MRSPSTVSAQTQQLIEAARSLPMEQFLARHRGYYLITAETPDALPTGFHTAVVDFSEPRPPPRFEVTRVAKAPGNPYPDRISIGRAKNSDIVLLHPSVSKLHAHIRVGDDKFELIDHNSSNGTRINGVVLTPQQPYALNLDDKIYFGTLLAVFHDAASLFESL